MKGELCWMCFKLQASSSSYKNTLANSYRRYAVKYYYLMESTQYPDRFRQRRRGISITNRLLVIQAGNDEDENQMKSKKKARSSYEWTVITPVLLLCQLRRDVFFQWQMFLISTLDWWWARRSWKYNWRVGGGFSILLLVVWGYEEIAGAQQRFRVVVENKHLRHETDWGLLVQHKKQLVYYSPEAGSQNIRSCGWLILSQDGQQLIGASPFWTHKNLSQEKDTPSTHNFFILHSISYVSAAIL